MSRKSRADEERALFQVVGYNCKISRELSGLTRADVMNDVWSYENNQKHANRVSELESGNKRIELVTFYRLCKALNVSADFLLGLSEDFEVDNLEAKVAGRIFQSIRSSVLDSTEQLCTNVAQSIRYLPPYQGEMLKTKAKAAVEIFNKHSHDLVFQEQYGDVVHAMRELQQGVMDFDKFFARQMRQIEMSMMNALDNDETEFSNKRLNKAVPPKKVEAANSENVQRLYEEREQADKQRATEAAQVLHEKAVKVQAREEKNHNLNISASHNPCEKQTRYTDARLWSRIQQLYESENPLTYNEIRTKVTGEMPEVRFPSQRTVRRRAVAHRWERHETA